MQIKLVIEEKNSSVICLKESLSISSWIIDYYYKELFSNQIMNIIGYYDMFRIYQIIQPSLSLMEILNLCKNKLKKIKNNLIIEDYNNYLSRCGLVDIIDIFHQCQFDSVIKTIVLSIENIKNDIDRLFLIDYFSSI
jgi:hypothetical protein